MKSTKIKCRNNNCMRYGHFETGICEKCLKLLNEPKKKSKPIRKISEREWTKYFNLAKQSFQKLRRLQEMDSNGICKCVNGEYRKWDKCQGGHYIPSKEKSTCFESMNVHPQTGTANRDMDNPIISGQYTDYMIKRYGKEEIDKLEFRSKQTRQWKVFEFKEMIDKYDLEIKTIIYKFENKK